MTRIREVCLGIGLAAMTFGSVGCGMVRNAGTVEYAMQGNDAAPAATGPVRASRTDNNNQELRIEVAHLPQPERLHPSLSTYVVWGRQPSGDATAMNLGQLSIDEDREGMLRVVTPFPELDIMVTAESSSTPDRPSEFVILEGQIIGQARR